MINKKFPKGSFLYYTKKRNYEIIKTLIMFGISGSLFIAGYAVTLSRANVLTIFAVLGMLPASKSAVSMYMYLHYHGCSETLKNTLSDKLGIFEHIVHSYGLVFTTEKVTYEVPSIIVKNGTICGYSEHTEKNFKELEKHISMLVSKNGFKCTVKIFNNLDVYETRVKQLMLLPFENEETDQGAMNILHHISL